MPLPAGAGGPEGGRTLRSASSMVVVACGSFTLGLELGRDAFPPAPTSSKASLGFSGGGGSTDGRVPGEASGGGGTTTASILGASTGAGIEGTGTGAGCGGRNRGARGTGAGGAALRTSRSRVILPRLGSFCVRSCGMYSGTALRTSILKSGTAGGAGAFTATTRTVIATRW